MSGEPRTTTETSIKVVEIDSLPDATLRILKPIPATVERIDTTDFVAQAPSADVCASGDTFGEAFENLKDMVAATFQYFSSLPPERLGPDPARQLAILKQHIQKQDRIGPPRP